MPIALLQHRPAGAPAASAHPQAHGRGRAGRRALRRAVRPERLILGAVQYSIIRHLRNPEQEMLAAALDSVIVHAAVRLLPPRGLHPRGAVPPLRPQPTLTRMRNIVCKSSSSSFLLKLL